MENKSVRLKVSSHELEGIIGHKLVTDFDKFRAKGSNMTEKDCENLLTEFTKNYFDSDDLNFYARFYHEGSTAKYRLNAKLSGEVIIVFPQYVDLKWGKKLIEQ